MLEGVFGASWGVKFFGEPEGLLCFDPIPPLQMLFISAFVKCPLQNLLSFITAACFSVFLVLCNESCVIYWKPYWRQSGLQKSWTTAQCLFRCHHAIYSLLHGTITYISDTNPSIGYMGFKVSITVAIKSNNCSSSFKWDTMPIFSIPTCNCDLSSDYSKWRTQNFTL